MLATPVRARRLAPALLAAAWTLNLAACDQAGTERAFLARQAQVDPPKLWLAQTLGPKGEVARSQTVCLDRALHDSLIRADAQVSGEPCRPLGAPVSRPGFYGLRCEAASRRFAITAASRGDLARDFTVFYAAAWLDSPGSSAMRTTRYRLVGRCPPGWRIGDQVPPGRLPSVIEVG
ncbi:MAG TPA: hypothetical protein VHV27_00540 [Phenylobacterium sp.]|jgi:hypothetical protein|nr:hypothetical protein [Phenylobacterium sp.]